ncbi:30S ribosomal protein [Dirofilaria immitis]
MACAVPILDSVGKYLAALPSSDLLPVRISGKSLCVFATEVLLKRIKPLFIKDGNITNPIDRWIFPTYETSEDIYRDFFAVSKWQSQFLLSKSNDLESAKYKSASVACFHQCYSSLIPQFSQINFDNICKCASKDAIFFPNAYTPNIAAVKGTIIFRNYVTEHKSKWKTAIKEAKLVFIFSKVSWSEMESATSDILSIRKNRSLPIIYVKSYMYFPYMPPYYYPFLSIVFHGSNVEASTFLVKTKDEKELREELLEWKRGLYFLKNYNIIAFYFMENEMITTNGKIFREIFNTEPFSVRFHKDWSKDVGPTVLHKQSGQYVNLSYTLYDHALHHIG